VVQLGAAQACRQTRLYERPHPHPPLAVHDGEVGDVLAQQRTVAHRLDDVIRHQYDEGRLARRRRAEQLADQPRRGARTPH